MDNGDRSGRDGEPDREGGSVDNRSESDGPTEGDSTGDDFTGSDSVVDDPSLDDDQTATGDGDAGDGDDGLGGADRSDELGGADRSDELGGADRSDELREEDGSRDERARGSGREYEERGGTEATGSNRDNPIASGHNDSTTDNGLLYRFRNDMDGPLMWIREMLSSVGIVLLIGLVLFGVSGVWPPMVAVESGSMEPNMEVGDLVFVTEPGRLAPDAAENEVGVVTHAVGETVDYQTFGSYGSVVIYRPPGRTASPIIHRAMFHVEAGENWYDRADDQYHSAANCEALTHCPAPHDGFITLGDNNGQYDQANGLAAPVRAEWVTGVARVRIPYLGYVRLIATGQAELRDVVATTGPIQTERATVRRVDEVSPTDRNDEPGNGVVTPDARGVVSGGATTAGVAT